MAVLLNENRFISSLEEMAGPLMPLIEELRINAVQLTHAQGKIAVGRFDQEMVMIVHEAVGVADPIVPFIDVLERIQKVDAILIVFEDGLLFITAGSDMIDSTGVFYAERTAHTGTLAKNKGNVKIKDLTLRC